MGNDNKVAAAHAFMDAGNHAAAKKLLAEVLAQDVHHERAFDALTGLMLQTREYSGLVDAAKTFLAHNPESDLGQTGLLLGYLKCSRQSEALAVLTQVKSLATFDVNTVEMLETAYNSKYGDKQAAFQKAASFYENQDDKTHQRLLALGDAKAGLAIAGLRKAEIAVAAGDNSPQANALVAILAYRAIMPWKSIPAALRTLRKKPDDHRTREVLFLSFLLVLPQVFCAQALLLALPLLEGKRIGQQQSAITVAGLAVMAWFFIADPELFGISSVWWFTIPTTLFVFYQGFLGKTSALIRGNRAPSVALKDY